VPSVAQGQAVLVDGDDFTKRKLARLRHSRHFLLGNPAHHSRQDFLILIGAPEGYDMVPDLEVLKLNILLALAVSGLVVNHDGLIASVHFLHRETVYTNGLHCSEHSPARRRSTRAGRLVLGRLRSRGPGEHAERK